MRTTFVSISALGAAALIASGCATVGSSSPSLGDINLRRYGSMTAPRTTFAVAQGRIFSPDLDLSVMPDGCVRGTIGSTPLQLCKSKDTTPPEREGAESVEHWQGASGDVVVEVERVTDPGAMQAQQQPGATGLPEQIRADGYLNPGGGRGVPVQATMPLGKGPQWDELRKNPVLLAIAGAAIGIRGEPDANARTLAR
jgi:hypothetical protein